MARNVYFDPFGSYTGGYDTGVQREMQVQDNTRRARAQDFNYNYMLPLEYKQAQRADELGAFGLPYQENAIRYQDQLGNNNVYTSNLGLSDELARRTGITAPAQNTMLSHFRITPHQDQYTTQAEAPNVAAARHNFDQNWAATIGAGEQSATPELRLKIAQQAGLHFGVDPRVLLMPPAQPTPVPQYSYTMIGPDGNPVNVGRAINPDQGLLNYLNRPAAMAEAATIYGMDKDAYTLQRQLEEQRQRQQYYNLQQNYYNQKYNPQAQTPDVSSSIIPGAF